uniref:Uncharacterized protein n=1 Tax=Triticum urartu TaxID=4572 RepID=A0A8R7PG89_TRIUA
MVVVAAAALVPAQIKSGSIKKIQQLTTAIALAAHHRP